MGKKNLTRLKFQRRWSLLLSLILPSFVTKDADTFFGSIKNVIPKIDNKFTELCESQITPNEIDTAVKLLSLDKSPGCDGLTSNFYQPFLLMLNEAIDSLTFPPTMKQGLITLIPKPGKDSTILDNMRPITLLNTDSKIVTLIYTNRHKKHLHQIISESQSGFMKRRSIHNNIRFVLDLLDYNQFITDPGFILFLDFYKAFDSIEHNFLFQSLREVGFGNNFCKVIEALYDNTNSCVSLPGGTSPRFSIRRGVKQGCPISPFSLYSSYRNACNIH